MNNYTIQQLYEHYGYMYKVKPNINESFENYKLDDLLSVFTEETQKELLSLPELPIDYMIEVYNDIELRNLK